MARRKRKKKVTYDSQETRTILGLISLIASITFFLALFVDPTGENFFTQIRTLFGQTTWVISFFLLNVGLALFGSKFSWAKNTSLFAQFILLILIPAFTTSLQPSKVDARLAAEQGLAGGTVGYGLAYELFSDTLVFAQYTPLILGIAVMIFAPIAINISATRIVDTGEKMLNWIAKALGTLAGAGKEVQETVKPVEMAQKAARFSDFNRAKEHLEDKKTSDTSTKQTKQVKDLPPRAESSVSIKVSQKEMGEAGLAHDSLMYPDWKLPDSTLLYPYRKSAPHDADKDRNSSIIEQTLASFGVEAKVMDAYIGPAIVQYALDLPLGINVKKVMSLSENLALALGVDSKSIRIETIPGTTYLGVEVPRSKRDEVKAREIMESEEMVNTKKNLPVTVGKDIHGNYIIADIQKMPHLLIAGATGSGKSVLTNSFITSLLMKKTPDELKLLLVDPKKVELSDYNDIPHLLTPVITDMDKVVNALKWCVTEMERRYDTLANAKVRDIGGYNQQMGFSAMPYIVIVIDEMADMMMTAGRADAETAIVRLAQKARAVGIHLILATQRPSVNVITGIIKANIPGRIGMSVASPVDSRVILDAKGAESLQGKGDLLYKPAGQKGLRLQSGNIDQKEIIKVVDFIKAQVPEVEYMTSILEDTNTGGGSSGGTGGSFSDDELFAEAVQITVRTQKGSSSYLQRQLKVGFNRAARLLDDMETAGVVGPQEGSKPRKVLIADANAFLAEISG